MINLTKLYFGQSSSSDGLRYGRGHVTPGQRKPVVVWTLSRRCNLHCSHCYTASEDRLYPGELTTDEGYALLEDLASFGVPALLMSGGEPLYRADFDQLALRASTLGLKVTVSTNGTLLTAEKAEVLKKVGVRYVGISLDGRPEVHDRFRGVAGAYAATIQGIRNCKAAGLPVGLRLTLTQSTADEMDWLFRVVDEEGIDRVCFYHLVYAGRGKSIRSNDLDHEGTRRVLDRLIEETRKRIHAGRHFEVLTVDQSADGPYFQMRLAQEDPARAEALAELLRQNGGGSAGSGVGICNIDPTGGVHPDQFWQAPLGNVRDRPFSQIWTDRDNGLLNQLRDRLPLLKGRCGSCRFQAECGGSFRARALAEYNDPWAEDPACYLTNEEIGLKKELEVRSWEKSIS
jgi:radical SAM protein with 4Fe4S-binding SPASM domain